MSDLRKAAEQAASELEDLADLLKQFEAPSDSCIGASMRSANEAAEILRAALAEPEQSEPDAYIHRQGTHWELSENPLLDDEKARGWTEEPLFAHPPRREPLTDEQIKEMWRKHAPNIGGIFEFAAEVEQYHGVKP